jgi:PTS system nitrogen regulatory IIA component
MLLTVRDVVRMLGVTENDLFRMVESAEIPVCKVHGQYRFNRDEVLEWATARRMTLKSSSSDSGVGGLPRLDEALRAGGVHRGIGGTDKKSVLTAAMGAISLPANVDRAFLAQMLLAREEMASTGIGKGIAIPHVRNPVILPIAESMVALCYLDTPIEFGALDGEPVHSLFLIFTTSTRGHLHILSRLMFALRDERFQAGLDARADVAQLVPELMRLEERFAHPGDGGNQAP